MNENESVTQQSKSVSRQWLFFFAFFILTSVLWFSVEFFNPEYDPLQVAAKTIGFLIWSFIIFQRAYMKRGYRLLTLFILVIASNIRECLVQASNLVEAIGTLRENQMLSEYYWSVCALATVITLYFLASVAFFASSIRFRSENKAAKGNVFSPQNFNI